MEVIVVLGNFFLIPAETILIIYAIVDWHNLEW